MSTVNDIATIVTAVAAMIAAVAAIRPEWFGRLVAALRPHARDVTIAGLGALVAWLATLLLGAVVATSTSARSHLETLLQATVIGSVVLTSFLGVRGVIIAFQQNRLARTLRAGTYLVAALGALVATFVMTAPA